jgi:plastocyanin
VPLNIVRESRGLAVVAVALGLCWCSRVPGAAANVATAATHTVTIEGTRFQPSALSVNTGDTVVWINKDPFPHTATAPTGAFDSKDIEPERTWRYVPMKKGTFAYVCSLHPTMKATLQVR